MSAAAGFPLPQSTLKSSSTAEVEEDSGAISAGAEVDTARQLPGAQLRLVLELVAAMTGGETSTAFFSVSAEKDGARQLPGA